MSTKIESAEALADRFYDRLRSAFHWGDGHTFAHRQNVSETKKRDLALVRAVREYERERASEVVRDSDEQVLSALVDQT